VVENLLAQAQAEGGDAVLESIRTPSEAEFLRSHGAQLWAVDADQKIRYERIFKRASETDHISFEKFQEDEAREMHNTDPAKQSIASVMQQANHTFHNNGTQEELFAQVEAVLQGVQ
jgi:dephospho-CoA kinase